MNALWAAVCCLAFVPPELPSSHTGRIAETPDLCQTDKAGHYAEGGKDYCGPTSAANHLIWFARNGYPRLALSSAASGKPPRELTVSPVSDGTETQRELVRTLASANYMRTAENSGTQPPRFVSGLQQYIEDRGYKVASLEFRGAMPARKGFAPAGEQFTLDWIRSGIAQPNSAVWLNIQWSTFDSETQQYREVGRHWVAVVGYGEDASGKPVPDMLMIHDPSGRSGLRKSTDYAPLRPVTSGRFAARGSKYDAAGYFEIREGLKFKAGSDRALVIGAVRLELAPAPAP